LLTESSAEHVKGFFYSLLKSRIQRKHWFFTQPKDISFYAIISAPFGTFNYVCATLSQDLAIFSLNDRETQQPIVLVVLDSGVLYVSTTVRQN